MSEVCANVYLLSRHHLTLLKSRPVYWRFMFLRRGPILESSAMLEKAAAALARERERLDLWRRAARRVSVLHSNVVQAVLLHFLPEPRRDDGHELSARNERETVSHKDLPAHYQVGGLGEGNLVERGRLEFPHGEVEP